MSEKLLSVVIAGRNDNYMGNYLYRLGTCLNFLAANLSDLGRLNEVEVMITDWGSDEPLREALLLTSEAAKITKFVEVSAEEAKEIYPDGVFYPSGSYNASIRRSKGKFIMLTDSDCMIPPYGMETLMEILSGNVKLPTPIEEIFFYIRRYQIPWEVVQRQPSVRDWRRYIQYHVGALKKEFPSGGMLGGFAAAQLIHRDRWNEMRAYDENLKGWGWCDNEIMIRMNQKYPWMDLITYGIFGLHMEHWSRNARREHSRSNVNPMVLHHKFGVNDANWGLADREFPINKATARPPERSHDYLPLKGRCFHKNLLEEDLQSDEVREFASGVMGRGQSSAEEVEAMVAISSFCLKEYPRNMLYVGKLMTLPLTAMFRASPGIESYFLSPWKEGITNSEPFNPEQFSGFLEQMGYCGYGRFLTVPWERIDESLNSAFSKQADIELIFIHRPTLGESFETIFPKLMTRLASGGLMIIFWHEAKDSEFWTKHISTLKVPASFLTFSSGRTSMIAKASTA